MRATFSSPTTTVPVGFRVGVACLELSADIGSKASCKVVPFQVHHFIVERQIGLENHEFVQGLALFFKGTGGEHGILKIIRAARTNGTVPMSSKFSITDLGGWQPVVQISCPVFSSSVAVTM